jgi:hypothetical protein
MKVIPYTPEHLKLLDLQQGQSEFRVYLGSDKYAQWLADVGPAYSGFVGDEMIACAGFVPQHENRAIVWALVGSNAAKHFLAIHRAVLKALNAHPYRRVETVVKTGFAEGARWAEMLGMQYEGTMRKHGLNGEDFDLYARVQ